MDDTRYWSWDLSWLGEDSWGIGWELMYKIMIEKTGMTMKKADIVRETIEKAWCGFKGSWS